MSTTTSAHGELRKQRRRQSVARLEHSESFCVSTGCGKTCRQILNCQWSRMKSGERSLGKKNRICSARVRQADHVPYSLPFPLISAPALDVMNCACYVGSRSISIVGSSASAKRRLLLARIAKLLSTTERQQFSRNGLQTFEIAALRTLFSRLRSTDKAERTQPTRHKPSALGKKRGKQLRSVQVFSVAG